MTQYISLKVIADDIADNPLLQDIPYERIINYAINLMRLIGCPRIFEDKIVTLEVKDYRCKLPCDFLDIVQIKNKDGVCYRHTTDSFHMELNGKNNYTKCGDYVGQLTYKIQGNYIYTSNREGEITVAYQAIALDNDGFPLIPDNSSFIEALEYYIKKKHYSILFDQGKIAAPVYQDACQQYAWYVGQAQSDLVRPTLDQMQSITNMMNTLITRVTDHDNGFINSGDREYLKRFN